MNDLMKLVRTYRLTAGLSQRLTLAEQIFRLIEPDLRLFVFGAIAHPAAQDALQEVLKAIAISLGKFQGSTVKEFWGWCYRIARNKLNDQFRKEYADRMQPVPPDQLWQMIEASAQDAPISPAVRHDLQYAMPHPRQATAPRYSPPAKSQNRPNLSLRRLCEARGFF